MTYLIVGRTQGKYYIFLREMDDKNFGLRAYSDKKEIMDDFKPYTEGWTGSYERSMSCTIGMMNMSPIAINAPENAEDLKQYIVNEIPQKITGGALGRGYIGLEVNEKILDLKAFDIWEESLILGGLKERKDDKAN